MGLLVLLMLSYCYVFYLFSGSLLICEIGTGLRGQFDVLI